MKSEKISSYLQTKIEAKDFPSAVYLVAERGKIVFADALGFAVVEPERIEVRIDTIYDLASLTKPLVTGLLAAKLIEAGEINLKDKVSKFFPEFDRDDKREITIANLLTHASGFPSWFPFYSLPSNDKQRLINFIAATPLENAPNTRVVYGEFNFIPLGFLIEKIYGARLDEITEREIFAPLGLRDTFYNPPPERREQIAGSERGNEFERQMCAESFAEISVPSSAFRNQIIWGAVHDHNCFFMGGVAGHAGLFSNAAETFRIARQFLAEESVLLKPETCRLFRTNFTPDLNEARSIAFQLAATKDSTASEALSKDSFGHLGFTGTSLWIEPTTERIYILLTNRTHARSLPLANLGDTRRRFHEVARSEFTL